MGQVNRNRANIEAVAQWVGAASEDAALLLGSVGISLPNADGDCRPVLYSAVDDPGCVRLLALLADIVRQHAAGLSEARQEGAAAPDWWVRAQPCPPQREGG